MLLQTEKYNVSGMTCNHCTMKVENSIKELEGVVNANADLTSSSVVITFDNEKTGFQQIEQAVESAGYEIYEN